MRTFVRFGGLTEADAVAAVPSGGAAGFVLGLADSPRSLPADRIRALVDGLPAGTEAWGQVVDPTAVTIRTLFEEVGVDRIELHGAVPEGLEYLEIHHLIPALAVPVPGTEGPAPSVPPAEHYPRLLLDAPGAPLRDGAPVRPDWEVCRSLVENQPGRKLTLSGGLDASNVAEAVRTVRPWGVAVCASVESAPGRSDPLKMRAFLEAVGAAEEGS